ncbi:MAG: hypothetical protein QOG73_1729 [Acetobacteraceae bacterium]|jgi:hypothetical protein|nr:hypothetical protein [Acetobacteraceae bacterium]
MIRALAAVYITPRSEKYRGFSHGFSILVQAVMADAAEISGEMTFQVMHALGLEECTRRPGVDDIESLPPGDVPLTLGKTRKPGRKT